MHGAQDKDLCHVMTSDIFHVHLQPFWLRDQSLFWSNLHGFLHLPPACHPLVSEALIFLISFCISEKINSSPRTAFMGMVFPLWKVLQNSGFQFYLSVLGMTLIPLFDLVSLFLYVWFLMAPYLLQMETERVRCCICVMYIIRVAM